MQHAWKDNAACAKQKPDNRKLLIENVFGPLSTFHTQRSPDNGCFCLSTLALSRLGLSGFSRENANACQRPEKSTIKEVYGFLLINIVEKYKTVFFYK